MGFFTEHFINPVIQSTGYNAYNTLAYAAIVLIALFMTAALFRKMKIKADERMFRSIVPFVVLGGVLRALQDMNLFEFLGNAQYFFVTPLIYILLYAVVMLLIIAENKTKKRLLMKTGLLLLFASLVPVIFSVKKADGLLITLALFSVIFLPVFFLLKKNILKGINAFPFAGQVLDACSSVTAISIIGGFTEQHVLPNLLFSKENFYLFIPLKVLLILAALYFIDKDIESKEWKFLLKITILAVGMGPGVRNTLTMII